MHPAAPFQWTDRAAMRQFVQEIGLGSLAVGTPAGPRCAIVPPLWEDDDRLSLHVSRGNALLPYLDGAQACYTVIGPHGYISPRWYGLPDQVPTWDYVAVELSGTLAALPRKGVEGHVARLSESYESQASGPGTWSLDGVSQARRDGLLNGIAAFELHITQWRGVRKLGQHKPAAAREAVWSALETSGQTELAKLARAEPGR